MPFNPIQRLKNSLLNFTREYYDSKVGYADEIINKWSKSLVTLIIYILVNGMLAYLVLSGIVFIFPKTSGFIFVGTKYWHIPIIVFYLGLIIWFIKEEYKYYKGGYKK